MPIVFVMVADPVGAGFVDSLARPGGNVTGFTIPNTSLARNGWNCSSRLRRTSTRVAVLRDPTTTAGIGQFGAIQSRRRRSAMELSPVNLRDAGEIERAVAAFARIPNGGLIVTPSRCDRSSRSDHRAGGPA